MNQIERDFRPAGLAEVEYLDGEYRIIRAGSFVLCAVSGVQIPLSCFATGASIFRKPMQVPPSR